MNASARNLVARIARWLEPPRIETGADLAKFLSGHAAFIAQRTVLDYCRAKTGLFSYALFEEEAFKRAFDLCRWEGYAAVLSDLFLVAEGHLRANAAPPPAALAEPLAAHFRACLESKTPEHRPQGWDDVIAAFDSAIRAAGAVTPKDPVDSVTESAKRIFKTLPIHHAHSGLDEEIILGSVRFRTLAMWQEMKQKVRPAEVVADLLRKAHAAA